MAAGSTGQRIKAERLQRQWSQEQLAAIAGVDVRTVQRIEAGRPASFDSLKALATAFEMNASALVTFEEPSKGANPRPTLLARITDGHSFGQLIAVAEGHQFHYEDVATQEAVELVGGFLQEIADWGEIWKDLGPARQVATAYELDATLRALERAGFLVFGCIKTWSYKLPTVDSEPTCRLAILTVSILGKSNPKIVRSTQDGEFTWIVFASP